MKIGKLRYRISLQEYSSTRDKDGFVTKDWNTVATVWADIVPVSGKEYFSQDTETSVVTYKVYIRYREDVLSSMRIVWEGHTFEIVSALGDKRSGLLTLMAREIS
jgi:SPP1 family predicted phage head-tail adaptor